MISLAFVFLLSLLAGTASRYLASATLCAELETSSLSDCSGSRLHCARFVEQRHLVPHARTGTRVRAGTRTCAHARTHPRTRTRTHTHARKQHKHTRTRSHTNTHARTRTRTHTHTLIRKHVLCEITLCGCGCVVRGLRVCVACNSACVARACVCGVSRTWCFVCCGV